MIQINIDVSKEDFLESLSITDERGNTICWTMYEAILTQVLEKRKKKEDLVVSKKALIKLASEICNNTEELIVVVIFIGNTIESICEMPSDQLDSILDEHEKKIK